MPTRLPLRNKSPFSSGTLVYGFSSRAAQNMSLAYSDTTHSLANRKDFLTALGINYQDLVCARQVHGSSVRCIDEPDRGSGALSDESAIIDTDSLITDKKNLPLVIFTADCLSIFVFDPERPAIGIVHAGWRSTKGQILTKTIRLMQECFNTLAENLYLGFGPCIRNCCYEVGEEFKEFFSSGIEQREGRYYLDLAEINKRQATGLGIRPEQIFDSGACTACESNEFFSYRRQGKDCPRSMSVIMLK